MNQGLCYGCMRPISILGMPDYWYWDGSCHCPVPRYEGLSRAPGRSMGGHRPGVTLTNVTIVNCGTGIKASGGHIHASNLKILNTPIAIDADAGALVEIDDLSHTTP